MQSFPHSADYRHFLTELRAAREAAGVTQQELADKLRVHQTVISKGELGTRRVDVVELRVWLEALGMPLAEFVAKLDARLGRHTKVPTLNRQRKRS